MYLGSERTLQGARSWRACIALAFAAVLAAAHAEDVADESGVPRHELEVRALVAPEAVLRDLPAALQRARASGDDRELALLHLARANACRVVADWACQRDAGRDAREAARRAEDKVLGIRSLIAESRGHLALQDYARGEQLLGLAQAELERTPFPVLLADVHLAYSSLSNNIDKHALAIEYADRGLAVLGPDEARPMQARLLRNRARAQAEIGDVTGAQRSLDQALGVMSGVVDPKLTAELHREAARLAGLRGDHAAQRMHAERILELGRGLANTQLAGIGHEVLGAAARGAGDTVTAESELRTALALFRDLKLVRDELRVARDLIELELAVSTRVDDVAPVVRRALELERTVIQSDRAQAADDFDARLGYAQRELDVLRLEGEAAVSRERIRATVGLAAAAVFVLVALVVFSAIQRRSNRRLRELVAALHESESRATDLLQTTKGFVFLHDRAGRLTMVNPATADALGATPGDLVGRPLADLVAEANEPELRAYLARVEHEGHDEGTLRMRPRDGSDRWWRYSSRRSRSDGTSAYVICTAVDVTADMSQAESLREQTVRDALTGAYNRRRLESFEHEHGPGASFGVVAIDLDHFKRINDEHGHDRGDQVLVAFARFLEARVREGDSVVRAGGDEFLVLLGHADDVVLDALVERLRDDRALAPCEFSMGHARRLGAEPITATIARADTAMYRIREGERGAGGTRTRH
jgi:diguanylate cyclase (GGDEF)-like protein/PAS domain S-box-containing protein